MRLRAEAGLLKEAFSLAGLVGRVARLRFDRGGVHVEAMDGQRVSLLSLRFERESFSDYEAAGADVPVHVDSVHSFLSACKPSDAVDIVFDGGILALQCGGLRLRAKTPLASEVRFRVPELSLPTKASLDMDSIQAALKANALLTEEVRIHVHGEGLRLSSGTDDDIVEVSIPRSELHRHEVDGDGAEGKFSMAHIGPVVKGIKGRKGHLSMKHGSPLLLEFTLSDESVTGRYLLAPRDG